MNEYIRICPNHQKEEKTPLIWTFAFIGAEYWCPACGYISGILGAGERVKLTKELADRLTQYKKLSKSFLKAKSICICARTKYKGEWIEPKDLPLKSQQYYIKKAKDWEYKY